MKESKVKLDQAYEDVMKSFDKMDKAGARVELQLLFLNGVLLGMFIASVFSAILS